MRRATTSHLKRRLALLEFAKSKMDAIRIYWRCKDIGSWETIRPYWWISGEKIWFQFHSEGSLRCMWIASIKQKPWGLHIFLSNPKDPISEVLELAWQTSMQDPVSDYSELWEIVHYWLSYKFPLHQVIKAMKRTDRARTFSGAFLRVFFRHAGKSSCLIAADESAGDGMHLAVSQGLLWISALTSRNPLKPIPMLYVLLPFNFSSVAVHRRQYLNRDHIKVEVWEYQKRSESNPEIRRAPNPAIPEENRDYR